MNPMMATPWYFPQKPFRHLTIDGKLFKNVTSQLSADEEIPEIVALPVADPLHGPLLDRRRTDISNT